MYGWEIKKGFSPSDNMHKAHVTTPETVRDMNPSANSIVQRTENGKKNLENIAFT
jgi:hypothetical protein